MHAESATSHETGGTHDTSITDSTGYQSAPLAIVPAYQHLQKFKNHKETLPEVCKNDKETLPCRGMLKTINFARGV